MASLVQAAGMAALTIGAALAWIPAGFLVGGACLVVFGLAMER